MYAAIRILEKAYLDSMAMQASPQADMYCNELQLAIKLLKKYQSKMEQEIDSKLKELTV